MEHTKLMEMQLDAAFYDLLMETSSAFYGALAEVRARLDPPLAPPPLLFQLRGGWAESPGWFLVQATEFAPDPLTVTNLRVRDVYASERIVQALLEVMAGEGWLERRGDTYHLTEAGRVLSTTYLVERPQRLLAEVTVRAPADVARLADLLRRLVAASCASSTPPGVWCLAHSRRRAPPPDALLLSQLRQYFEDFNAFRDDAHMAAWQPYGLVGYAWEALALVCSGAAQGAASVFAQLAHRGYSQDEYGRALADLQARGWLASAPAPDTYQVTAEGRAVRAAVEERTDAYFYAPWACLTAAERAALPELLQQLRDSLGDGTGSVKLKS